MKGWRRPITITLLVVIASCFIAVGPAISSAATGGGVANSTSTDAYVTVGNVSVAPDDPVTGEDVLVEATFKSTESSSGSARITEVSLRGPSTFVTADDVGSLGPGSSVTIPFSTSFESAGQKRLTVSMRGYKPDGSIFVVKKPVYITVDEATIDPDLTATATQRNGTSVLDVTLAEHGTVTLEDIRVDAVVDGETVARASTADIGAQTERTVTFDGSDIMSGNVTLLAHYSAAASQATTTTSVEYTPQDAGNMAATGIEVTGSMGSYTISGDASNLGSADATSVVISIPSTTSVTNGESYYVGEVETSEFATFEVSGDVSGNVERIPLQLNYSANGEQHSKTINIDVSNMNSGSGGDSSGTNPAGSHPGGDLPLTGIGLGVVVLVVVGAVLVYWWRNP